MIYLSLSLSRFILIKIFSFFNWDVVYVPSPLEHKKVFKKRHLKNKYILKLSTTSAIKKIMHNCIQIARRHITFDRHSLLHQYWIDEFHHDKSHPIKIRFNIFSIGIITIWTWQKGSNFCWAIVQSRSSFN